MLKYMMHGYQCKKGTIGRWTAGLLACSLAACVSGCGEQKTEVTVPAEPIVETTVAETEVSRFNIAYSNNFPKKASRTRTGILSGEWVEARASDYFRGFYIYELDDPVACSGFSLDYTVEITDGGPCDEWEIYVRENGTWHSVGVMTLQEGFAAQRFQLDEPLLIDAVFPSPLCDGDLGWQDEIAIYNVQKTEPPATEPEEMGDNWLEGKWGDTTYRVNDAITSVYELNEPIVNCRKLKVAMLVEMNYGARCEDWKVYAWNAGSWTAIGDLYLPGGDGEVEAEFTLDHPMTVSGVIIVPKIPGSYSWSCGIAVCDKS